MYSKRNTAHVMQNRYICFNISIMEYLNLKNTVNHTDYTFQHTLATVKKCYWAKLTQNKLDFEKRMYEDINNLSHGNLGSVK